MALTSVDRDLLSRCLDQAPGAWTDFVDRFAGLFIHVIRHSAEARSVSVSPSDEEEILSEIFLAILADNMAVLRRFAGRSSMATYLAVVARRVAIPELIRRRRESDPAELKAGTAAREESADTRAAREVVDQLLEKMPQNQAVAVRMHHLEGRSYRDVGRTLGMAENSVGSLLTRARRTLSALLGTSAATGR